MQYILLIYTNYNDIYLNNVIRCAPKPLFAAKDKDRCLTHFFVNPRNIREQLLISVPGCHRNHLRGLFSVRTRYSVVTLTPSSDAICRR